MRDPARKKETYIVGGKGGCAVSVCGNGLVELWGEYILESCENLYSGQDFS